MYEAIIKILGDKIDVPKIKQFFNKYREELITIQLKSFKPETITYNQKFSVLVKCFLFGVKDATLEIPPLHMRNIDFENKHPFWCAAYKIGYSAVVLGE